jgi:hypothetical protein
MTEVVSIRLPAGTITQLKLLACKRSLEQGREVRWTSLLKEAIAQLLRGQGHE